jgi:hypothetical protein
MNRLRKPWTWTLLGLLGVCVGWAVTPEVEGQSANSVGGQAIGTFAATPLGTLASTPLATLPDGGGMGDGENAAVDVTGVLKAQALSAVTTGVIGENASSAQSLASAADVNILNGVVTARGVMAMASSASNGMQATSTDAGSTIVDLVVNGVSMGVVSPQPNTTIDVPAVGTVILNEQVASGGGVIDKGLSVNMIHVILKNPLTGAKTGDIVVGSASSYAKFVR